MARILEGSVVSNKREKTITVQVKTTYMHKRYGKACSFTEKYHVHVEEVSAFSLGQVVKIVETAPISKTKKWKIYN